MPPTPNIQAATWRLGRSDGDRGTISQDLRVPLAKRVGHCRIVTGIDLDGRLRGRSVNMLHIQH